jgi:ATP-dependent protease Clp ATPase subunit
MSKLFKGKGRKRRMAAMSQALKHLSQSSLLPKEVVKQLNEHIVGQSEAKKAVAVALR